MGFNQIGNYKEEFGEVRVFYSCSWLKPISVKDVQIEVKMPQNSFAVRVNMRHEDMSKSYVISNSINHFQIENSDNSTLINIGYYRLIEECLSNLRFLPSIFSKNVLKHRINQATINSLTKDHIFFKNNGRSNSSNKKNDLYILNDLSVDKINLLNKKLCIYANFDGNINGCEKSKLILKGEVKGDIKANEILLGSKSHLNGDLECVNLIIEAGADFNGTARLFPSLKNRDNNIYDSIGSRQ